MRVNIAISIKGIKSALNILLITLCVSDVVVAANTKVLEEITVTATRRGETDIQTTPISVSALDENALDKLLPHDLNDIAAAIPNFIGGVAPSFNSLNVALRGIGKTDISLYEDSPVGVSIDDFVIPHVQTQALEPFDIESIEVLRGPQGTLFGKNTTAGVINVRTKRPVIGERSIEARALYGEYDLFEGRYAVNFGITDTLAVRAAGIYQKSDGYYKNGKVSRSFDPFTFQPVTYAGDGRDLGGDDVYSGRLKLLWEPSEEFTALFQYEIIRDNSDSPPTVNISTESEVFPQLGFVQPQDGFNGVTSGDPLEQAGISDRCDVICLDKGHQIDVDGFYLNLDWTPGIFSIHSVTGYRDQESRLASTFTGEVRTSLFDATRDDNRQTFQQELRVNSHFAGPVDLGTIDVVGGTFYQNDETEFCVAQALALLDFFGPAFSPNTLLAANGFPPVATNTHNANPSVVCNRHDASAFAVFGDVTWNLTNRLSINGGFRQTFETKEWAGRAQTWFQFLDGTGIPDENLINTLNEPLDAVDFERFPFGVARVSESWAEPSWRVTVAYQFTDDIFGWVTRSRSFKSGAFNDVVGTFTVGVPTPLTNPRQVAPTDPEIANSWEVGLKADWFNNRVRTNITLYLVNYDDAQRRLNAVFALGGGATFQEGRSFNAAQLESYGVEFEGAWQVTDNLTVSGNFSWQEATFDEFQADTNFNGVIEPNEVFSDREVNRAPEWLSTVMITYEHTLIDWGELSHNVMVAFEDDQLYRYSTLGPAFDVPLESKTIVNWSTTFTDKTGKYSLRVFGKNLTDERYKIGVQPVSNLWTTAAYGTPRWFGGEFRVKFDF